MPEMSDFETILEYWFGQLDEHGLAPPEKSQRWWRKSPSFDAELRERFEPVLSNILANKHDAWLQSARGHLAQIIVLDQFARNMYRDTQRMYENDARALSITEAGIAQGHDRELSTDPRLFFYMPLMHCESLGAQDRCVELLTALEGELHGPPRERVASSRRFAIQHRDIIARFGRFPHRNAILARTSTPDEEQFLTEPGSSF